MRKLSNKNKAAIAVAAASGLVLLLILRGAIGGGSNGALHSAPRRAAETATAEMPEASQHPTEERHLPASEESTGRLQDAPRLDNKLYRNGTVLTIETRSGAILSVGIEDTEGTLPGLVLDPKLSCAGVESKIAYVMEPSDYGCGELITSSRGVVPSSDSILDKSANVGMDMTFDRLYPLEYRDPDNYGILWTEAVGSIRGDSYIMIRIYDVNGFNLLGCFRAYVQWNGKVYQLGYLMDCTDIAYDLSPELYTAVLKEAAEEYNADRYNWLPVGADGYPNPYTGEPFVDICEDRLYGTSMLTSEKTWVLGMLNVPAYAVTFNVQGGTPVTFYYSAEFDEERGEPISKILGRSYLLCMTRASMEANNDGAIYYFG